MKNRFTLLLLLSCLIIGGLQAQNIQLIMSPNPSPYISDWSSRTETASLIISNTTGNDIQVKLKTEIFDGKGSVIANTENGKMPVLTVSPGINRYNPEDIIPGNAVSYKGALATSTMKTGKIPEDNYKICVALIDPKTFAPLGTSGTVCKFFKVVSYQAPILQLPKDKGTILDFEARGVMFRWSPVVPAPSTIVTYRLQIWEVLPGQDPMTALRSNQPIVEKDLKGVLQTQWPIDFVLPEAGRRYVWTVTPLDGEDRKLVDGAGFAEPFVFSVAVSAEKTRPFAVRPKPNEIITAQSSAQSPRHRYNIGGISTNNSMKIEFEWTTVPNAASYKLKIYELESGEDAKQLAGGPGKRIPITDRDINAVTYSWPVPDEYLNLNEELTFEWSIQAIDKNGKGYGENDGKSEVYSFIVKSKGIANQGPVKLYSNISNERGVKGVGIHNPNSTSTGPLPNSCNQPNGLCYWAQIAPNLDDIQTDVHNVEVFAIDKDKLRFVFTKAPIYNDEAVRKEINGRIDPNYLESYLNHIKQHYLIPKDIAFSNADSKRLLNVLNKVGNKVVLKQGDYPIYIDAEYKLGYFDVTYLLDSVITDSKISVNQNGKDWYFTTTVSAIKNLINEGTSSRQAITSTGIPFACQYDFNNCCSKIGLINGIITNPNYSIQDYYNCLDGLHFCIESRQYTSIDKLPKDWADLRIIEDDPRRPDKVHVKIPIGLIRRTNRSIKDVSVVAKPYIEGVLFEFTVTDVDSSSGKPIEYQIYLLSRRNLQSGKYDQDTVVLNEKGNMLTFNWTLKQFVPMGSEISYKLKVYEDIKGQSVDNVINSSRPIFEQSTKSNMANWDISSKIKDFKSDKTFVWTVQTMVNGKILSNYINEHSTIGMYRIPGNGDIIIIRPPPRPRPCPGLPFSTGFYGMYSVEFTEGFRPEPSLWYSSSWTPLSMESGSYVLSVSTPGLKRIRLNWNYLSGPDNDRQNTILGLPNNQCPPNAFGNIYDGSTLMQIWKLQRWACDPLPNQPPPCCARWEPLIYGPRNYVEEPMEIRAHNNLVPISTYLMPPGNIYLIRLSRCGFWHYFTIRVDY